MGVNVTVRPATKSSIDGENRNKEYDQRGPQQAISSSQPLTPAVVLKSHVNTLTEYEQGEILEFRQVYFTGNNSVKVQHASGPNHGFDDDRGDYHIRFHDHIAYRFEVLSLLGKGSFGQCVKVYDYKTNTLCALKLIRNKKRFHHQALIEVKILEHLRDADTDNKLNIIHMFESFYFRSHLCITFELLSINLYEYIKINNFQGFSLSIIRRIALQVLQALKFQHQHNIIHCDLKPENILLLSLNKTNIKVIDYGSSCYVNERVYTYIQSRFYRSPEVILGLPYSLPIDMWSFGSILAELYTGYPLFPGENEVEQLACIMEIFGVPPRSLVEQSSRRKLFFDSQGHPRIVPNSRGKKRRPATKDLAEVLHCNDMAFLSFLEGCLRWDPKVRFTPDQAIAHAWIQEGTHGHGVRDPTTSRHRRRRHGAHESVGLPEVPGAKVGSKSYLPPIEQDLGLAAGGMPKTSRVHRKKSNEENNVPLTARYF